jgi:predicted nucleic acid-binding protein
MTVGVAGSTIIIHLFRKNPLALAWYASLFQPLAVTPITWMEIIYGAAGKAGQAKCKTILDQFAMEYLTRADMDWAMQQLERYRLSDALHGLKPSSFLGYACVNNRYVRAQRPRPGLGTDPAAMAEAIAHTGAVQMVLSLRVQHFTCQTSWHNALR